LNIRSFRKLLWEKAKQRFPDDYTGELKTLPEGDGSERWKWLCETFLSESGKRIGRRAGLAWNAIDAAFAASFADIKPEPPRGFDATPFTLPFNPTICVFNTTLRELIAEAGLRRRALLRSG
jgi:hypothetical protein